MSVSDSVVWYPTNFCLPRLTLRHLPVWAVWTDGASTAVLPLVRAARERSCCSL